MAKVQAEGDVVATGTGRGWRIALALLGSLWSLVLLAPQSLEWMGSGTPLWLVEINRWAVYDGARNALALIGVRDYYLVFGAASALSLLAIGIALLPDLRRSGWAGVALLIVSIGGSVIVLLSYLNHRVDAPLHGLWGMEFYVLVAIAVLGLIAAITFGRHGWPWWTRILLGFTPVILSVSILVFGYWPHGPFIAFGIEAAVLIAGAPRERTDA